MTEPINPNNLAQEPSGNEDFFEKIKKSRELNSGFKDFSKTDRIKDQQEENELLGKKHDGQKATLRHSIFKIALVSFSVMIGLVLFVRFIHLVIPRQFFWLDEAQITLIDTFFVSAFVGGFVAKNITKVFGFAEH